jgi:hypothetical protein
MRESSATPLCWVLAFVTEKKEARTMEKKKRSGNGGTNPLIASNRAGADLTVPAGADSLFRVQG